MKRDYQRKRVYDWENSCLMPLSINRKNLTLDECYSVMEIAIKKSQHTLYRLPNLHDGRGHRRAASYGGCIALPKWARQDVVVLHELAHELTPGAIPHGPEFVYVYINLLHAVLGRSKAVMKMEAADMGVDYLSM